MPSFGHPHFYNNLIRRYVILFGSMFDDLTVQRNNADGTVGKSVAVPFSYAPKEKWLARLRVDEDLQRSVQLQLPAASFEIMGFTYDGTRRQTHRTKEKIVYSSTDVNKGTFAYVPTPWNIGFALYLYVKNADDGAQMLEQILPFFGPEWTNTMNIYPALGHKKDIVTVLNSINLEDTYAGDFQTRRAIVWTLNFTMKAYFYGPTQMNGVIKDIRIGLRDLDNLARLATIRIIPGLTANSTPTTDINVAVDPLTVESTDDYGFAQSITESGVGDTGATS